MLTVFQNLQAWRSWRSQIRASVGFVPTMGALHEGHKVLIEKCYHENPVTVVSIFVNPTQFNQKEDFDRYPRVLNRDIDRLCQWGLTDVVVLAPSNPQELYPDNYRYRVEEKPISEVLCGAYRPGHFTGVLTVVMKLFWWVLPDKAYFGLKDYQQFRLIQDMVEAFGIPVKIIGVETVRDPQGLALSSRLERLNPEELKLAQQIYPLLKQSPSCEAFIEEATRLGMKVEYCQEWENRRLTAVWIGNVRLIDNIPLDVV